MEKDRINWFTQFLKSRWNQIYNYKRSEEDKDQIFDWKDFEKLKNRGQLTDDEIINEYIEKRVTKKIALFNYLKNREKSDYDFFQISIIIIPCIHNSRKCNTI